MTEIRRFVKTRSGWSEWGKSFDEIVRDIQRKADGPAEIIEVQVRRSAAVQYVVVEGEPSERGGEES